MKRAATGLAVALGVWLAGGVLQAQDFKSVPATLPVQVGNTYNKLRRGVEPTIDTSDPAKTQENQKEIDQVAKWLAYRLTHPVNHSERTPTSDAPMTKLVEEAFKYMPLAPMKQNRLDGSDGGEFQNKLDFVQVFGKAMTNRLNEVLKHPTPIVKVNAGRLLAHLGKSGYAGVADTYVEILTGGDRYPEVVKYYAAEGLKNLFAVSLPDDPDKSIFAVKGGAEREAKAVQALIAFILRPSPLPEKAEPERVEAVRFVRREAVRALGLVRQGVFRDAGTGKVLARPALVLLQVATRQEILKPSPSVTEQAEAMIGFCQLTVDEKLNADYAAYCFAKGMESFARAAVAEALPGATKGLVPWKVTATRLNRALSDWKARVPQQKPAVPEAAKLFPELADHAIDEIVKPIESPAGGGAQPAIVPFMNWVEQHKPKTTMLFEGEPDTAFKFATPGEK